MQVFDPIKRILQTALVISLRSNTLRNQLLGDREPINKIHNGLPQRSAFGSKTYNRFVTLLQIGPYAYPGQKHRSIIELIVIKTMRAFMPQIARSTWPTWGQPGSCRPQVGRMLAPWTLLSGADCLHHLSHSVSQPEQNLNACPFPISVQHGHALPIFCAPRSVWIL